jgi:hypothetical protein
VPHAPNCDLDFPPTAPVFQPNGVVYVPFLNFQHAAAWEPGECCESQIMLVRSTDWGDTWSAPVHVTDLEDGSRDYDCSGGYWGCRLTGTNLCPSCSIEGSDLLAVDSAGTLYVSFDDNRNGFHDVDHPVSNYDVFIMASTDAGTTWTDPAVVSNAPGDQFKPNVAVNPFNGELGILFYDRSDDPNGKTMNVTLATGVLGSFDLRTITTASSHLNGDLWDQQTLPDCKYCVFHIGEYIGLAYGSDGVANMTWTDLRHFTIGPNGRMGYTMNIDYARSGR